MSVSNLRDKLEALALFKNCQLFVINEVKFILLQKKNQDPILGLKQVYLLFQ